MLRLLLRTAAATPLIVLALLAFALALIVESLQRPSLAAKQQTSALGLGPESMRRGDRT
jgi:hypothetical protein